MSMGEYRPVKNPADELGTEVEKLRSQVIGLLVENESLKLENFKLRKDLYGPQNLGTGL